MQHEAIFRVHFDDGHKMTLAAKNADEARRIAKKHYPEVKITKAKRLREKH